jgi:hypothetical protein
MGATSAQGWYLFSFILGFTLTPAGLFALGWPVALVGIVLLAVALGGFRSIKEPAMPGRAGAETGRAASSVGARGQQSVGGAA